MERVIIYVRVSTIRQDNERQIQELTALSIKSNYHIVEIVSETGSGSKLISDREGLKRVIELSKTDKIDKLLISEVSRLGRKTSEVLKVIELLTDLKISIYINNYSLETLDARKMPNPVAAMIFTLLSETAKLEKETMIMRIKSGLDEAKRKGIKLGRPQNTKKSIKEFISKNKRLFDFLDKGLSLRNIGKICDCSTTTVLKARKMMAIRANM